MRLWLALTHIEPPGQNFDSRFAHRGECELKAPSQLKTRSRTLPQRKCSGAPATQRALRLKPTHRLHMPRL
jgi:hypothetical protein